MGIDGFLHPAIAQVMHSLTHAPLPDWGDLASLATAGPADFAQLARPWRLCDEAPFWFSRSAWSLRAIAELRARVTGRRAIRAWFPGYFCNESLGPLRALGVQLEFYPVAPDGTPDMRTLDTMITSGRPDIIVVVHYFGQPTPLDDVCRLAEDAGAWMVEDAAHVLRPVAGIGERGDFVLYSPHKLLPIPDGALMLVRDDGPGRVRRAVLSDADFSGPQGTMIARRRARGRKSWNWLARRLAQKVGIRASRSVQPGFNDDVAGAGMDGLPSPGMSIMARHLLSGMTDELDREATLRQVNQAAWSSIFRMGRLAYAGLETLSMNHAPYLAGFRHPNAAGAEMLYSTLLSASIPVVTWPDLPPEVRADPARQRVAIEMRETRVFLPVHRTVNPTRIESSIARLARPQTETR